MVLGTIILLFTAWVLPSALAAGVVMLIVELLRLLGLHAWYVWGLLLPSLYLSWLVSYLFFCGLSLRPIEKRYPKPRRAVFPGKRGQLLAVFASSARRASLDSLPLVDLLKATPWGLRLLIWAYSPPMRIGHYVTFLPPRLPEDPDMTELGDNVLLGAKVAIGAHFWKVLPDGRQLFVREPVKIGARATIGAYSVVTLGCTVGEDAIVEPLSYLPPHTQIPAGEVWGGRPATFQRKNSRTRSTGVPDEAAPQASAIGPA